MAYKCKFPPEKIDLSSICEVIAGFSSLKSIANYKKFLGFDMDWLAPMGHTCFGHKGKCVIWNPLSEKDCLWNSEIISQERIERYFISAEFSPHYMFGRIISVFSIVILVFFFKLIFDY